MRPRWHLKKEHVRSDRPTDRAALTDGLRAVVNSARVAVVAVVDVVVVAVGLCDVATSPPTHTLRTSTRAAYRSPCATERAPSTQQHKHTHTHSVSISTAFGCVSISVLIKPRAPSNVCARVLCVCSPALVCSRACVVCFLVRVSCVCACVSSAYHSELVACNGATVLCNAARESLRPNKKT